MPFYNQPKDQQEQEKYLAAADQPEVLAHAFMAKPEDEIFASAKPEDEEDGPEVEGHALTRAKPEDEDRFRAH